MKKVFCVCAALMLLLCGCGVGQDSTLIPAPTSLPTATARIAPTATAEPVESTDSGEFTLPAALAEKGGASTLSVYDVQGKTTREMSVEEYLACVVAGEMPVDFPEQALMAQAVVARTFLVNFLATKGGSQIYPGADISTDIEESQAFSQEAVTQDVIHAVEQTRGMILTYEGQPIRAWFHAASGGMTATAAEGLSFDKEETPYIVPVESDESNAPAEIAHWEATFTRQEVEAALAEVMGEKVEFDEVEAGETGESGRITSLLFSGTSVPVNPLRIALGSTKFRSTLLESVTFAKDTLHLSGRGYGHGVGMSQWGASQMASSGEDFSAVLAHYYPGTVLTQIWE